MKKLSCFLVSVIIFMLYVIPVGATSIDEFLDSEGGFIEDLGGTEDIEDTDGSVLVDQVGQVDSTSNTDTGSITDVMGNWSSDVVHDADQNVIKEGGSFITNVTGTIVSVAVVLMFAAIFILTAIDLFYIVVPPARQLLLNNEKAKGMASSSSEYSEAHFEKSVMGKGLQLVSDQLKLTVNEFDCDNSKISSNNKVFLVSYLKKRSVSMILLAVCVMLLLGSSIFTDFGWNVGKAILSKLLG